MKKTSDNFSHFNQFCKMGPIQQNILKEFFYQKI